MKKNLTKVDISRRAELCTRPDNAAAEIVLDAWPAGEQKTFLAAIFDRALAQLGYIRAQSGGLQ